MYYKKLQYFFPVIIILLFGVTIAWYVFDDFGFYETSKPTKVELVKKNGKYFLLRNGKPFFIKGAGVSTNKIESLAKHGANSLRTWSVNNGQSTAKEILDEAYKYGLMVCMGIEVGNERWGFDYDDKQAIQKQLKRIENEVNEIKNHPALLMWGIGNELNLDYTNKKVWDAVNDIAALIHKIDPNHPTTTMLASVAVTEDVNQVIKQFSEIDFLSFQIYGDILNLPKYIEESNYDGAYLISEWGPTGHWEAPRTSWDRPIEESSREKADVILERYNKVILSDSVSCLGSFVFLWGQKQERTPTWYGLFLESGEETAVVDVMHFLWTEKWPENRSPILHSLSLNGKNASANIKLKKEMEYTAVAKATDTDGDKISYSWSILPEVLRENQSEGGEFEKHSKKIIEYNKNEFGENFVFSAPKPGEYRLFVYASDGNGHAATANIPFLVIKK